MEYSKGHLVHGKDLGLFLGQSPFLEIKESLTMIYVWTTHKFSSNYTFHMQHFRPWTTNQVRATSHTRLRAHDHRTSSTLIGEKGGASPSSLHTTLEGPTEYVNARWMWSLHGFLHGIEWIMFMIIWTIFKNHLLEVGLTQDWETMTLQTLTTVALFYFIMCEDPQE